MNTTNLNCTVNPQLPSAFVSLSDLLGIDNIELSQLIAKLTYLKPEKINSLSDLAGKIKECPIISDEELRNICHTINILASKQFSYPIACSIREIVANALDAQIRAGNEMMPIEITLEKNRFVITDQGDGFGYESIIHYFVQGRSSNASQSLPTEERMAKVTGRFGQGGMSALYFLLYHTLSNGTIVPCFKVENNRTTLSFKFSADGREYEAFCEKLKDEEKVRIEIRKLDPEGAKKISIKSRRGNEALKIKLVYENNCIRSNIFQTDSSMMKVSTRYKIVSPLIAAAGDEIIQSIHDNFKFVTSSPIKLNGSFINDFKQMSSSSPQPDMTANPDIKNSSASQSIERKHALQSLDIEGGSLCYSPLPPINNRNGTLLICEGGKTIMQFPLDGHLVPEKVALNFDYLKLTQDRNTIDFKDPIEKEFVKKTLNAIWIAPKLTIRQKSTLLNALYPLLKNDRFDLTKNLMELISDPDHPILPDLAEFEHLENIFLLNPKYLNNLNFPIFYQTRSCCFYQLPWSVSNHIVCSKLGEIHVFFLDHRLFNSKTKQHNYFNVTLINEWLEEKKYSFRIDSEKAVSLEKDIEKSKPVSNQIGDVAKKYDLKKYEADETGNETGFLFTLEGLGITPSENIPKERQGATLKFLESMLSKTQPKKVVRFFFDLLCNDDEIFKFCLENKVLLPRITGNTYTAFNLFFQAYLYLKTYPEEVAYYRIFYRHNVKSAANFSAEIVDYQEYYFKWKKLIDAAGVSDEEFLSDHPIYFDLLDVHLGLVEQFGRQESNILECISGMDDVSYLLSATSEQRSIIFSLTRDLYKHNGSVRSYNRKDYEKMLSIHSQIGNAEKRDEVVFLYFCFQKFQLYERSIFRLDMEILEEEIISIAKENCGNNKISSILADIKKTLINISNINFGVYHIIMNCADLKKNNPATYHDERSCIPAFVEWANSYFGNVTQEQIRLSVEGYFDWFEDTTETKEFFLHWYEKHHFILPQARPFFYAIFLGKDAQFQSKEFVFPTLPASAIPLHRDPDVLDELKDVELAETRIKNALCQSVEEFDWILEAIKNCIEAGAKNVDFKVHLAVDGKIIVEIKDDAGMQSKNLRALKIPGVTSKRRDKEDPNYGWGFFTLLNKSEELYGTTSADGVEGHNLHFKKNEGGMLFHSSPTNNCVKGTKFLLKMEAKEPTRTLVKIMANVINICHHCEGISITFNDKIISGTAARKPEVSHSENLVENGKFKGTCEIKIGKTDEGLYRDKLRIESISEEYLSLLPTSFAEEMKGEGMRFAIFLPKVKQNMNRNQLINHSSTGVTIQRGVLVAAIKYFNNKCLKGFKTNSIPIDFWYDFRTDYKPPAGFLGNFLDAICHGDWGLLSDRQETEQQDKILNELSQFFATSGMQELSFPYGENSLNLNQFMDSIRLATLENHLSNKNDSLKKLLGDKRSLTQILLFLPLNKDGMTLNTIHNSFKLRLKEISLINGEGVYSGDILKLPPDDCRTYVRQCAEKICKDLGLDQNFDSVMNLFTSSILERIKSIQEQEKLTLSALVPCPALENFFVEVAKKLLSRDVKVEFYSKPDGKLAYTRRDSTIIYVNQCSNEFQKLNSILESFLRNNSKIEDMNLDCIKTIVDWLKTLCHEITHQKENQDCHTTHDEVFRDQLCELLLKLLVIEGGENSLEILLRSSMDPDN